jgi:hypothetical protein
MHIDELEAPLALEQVHVLGVQQVQLGDFFALGRGCDGGDVLAGLGGVRGIELQAGEAVQEDLVRRRIADRPVDAEDGDLDLVARPGIAFLLYNRENATMTRERSQPIRLLVAAGALVVAGLAALPAPAQDAPKDGLIGQINLATSEGVAQVKGQWRFHLVETGVGPKKNQIEPKAHGAFDDSQWEVVKPETLKEGRGPGKYSFAWYRIKVTIPDRVGGKDFSGGPVWFQTTVDDYGEVWVNGAIDLAFGKTGRGAVSGFNTPNRVRLQVTDEKENAAPRPRRGAAGYFRQSSSCLDHRSSLAIVRRPFGWTAPGLGTGIGQDGGPIEREGRG